MARINVRELQSPIRQRYKDDPQAAQIRLRVRSAQADLSDPLHCSAVSVSTPDISWRSGAHPAVGGQGGGSLEKRPQLAERAQGEEASVGVDDLFFFQAPGVFVRDEDRVETGGQRGVDV